MADCNKMKCCRHAHGMAQVLYSMPPTNFTVKCTPSPLPALAQGLVAPGDTVPAGAATPTQAWASLLTV